MGLGLGLSWERELTLKENQSELNNLIDARCCVYLPQGVE